MNYLHGVPRYLLLLLILLLLILLLLILLLLILLLLILLLLILLLSSPYVLILLLLILLLLPYETYQIHDSFRTLQQLQRPESLSRELIIELKEIHTYLPSRNI